MGYTTYFDGQIKVDPPLSQDEIQYLRKFASTRRMNRKNGPYFVDGTGFMGQNEDPDVIDSNHPPEGQPNLWCQWVPTDDGTAIEWDEQEKFYDADKWMEYLIDHFIGSNPIAKDVLPFLQGHVCNGQITATGEDGDDHWLLCVTDNEVTVRVGRIVYE